MALLAAWNKVRVYATWRDVSNGAMMHGRYELWSAAGVIDKTDSAIVPAGMITSGDLNILEGAPSLDVMCPSVGDTDISGTVIPRFKIWLLGMTDPFVVDLITSGVADIDLAQVTAASSWALQGAVTTPFSNAAVVIPPGGGGGGTDGLLTVTDNGDGTTTLVGTSITDNGDGTFTANSSGVTDNGDGTYTATG